MVRYIVRRLLALIPVLFVVSTAIFLISHLTPGDAASIVLGEDATKEELERFRESLGLNDPLPVQYIRWFSQVVQGDFGESFFLQRPVASAILGNFAPTVLLASGALAVTLILSIPLGTLAAKMRGSIVDHGVMVLTLFGMALPSFVLALILIIVFAVTLRLLPAAGYVSPFDDPLRSLRYLILPTMALGMLQAALLIRTTRAAVLDVLNADYIVAARSRGIGERRLLFVHTLRNAGLPILTTVGLTFGGLMTGAVISETIFNIPGIGSLLVNAITRRDYPMIQGVMIFVTLTYVVINLVVDLLYASIDPRVRLQQ